MNKILINTAIGLLALVIMSFLGCASGPDAADHKIMIEGVHAADQAFGENDIDAYMSHFTPDFVHDNVSGAPSSRKDFEEMVVGFFQSFPGVENHQRDLLASGPFLIFDECTFDIPLPGSDIPISVFHMDVVEMAGNKLKVKTTYGDSAVFPVAFGQIEPPVPKPRPASFMLPDPQPSRLLPVDAQNMFQNLWNSHDLESLAAMFHSNAEILVSPLLNPVGRADYIGWMELFFGAFPDVRLSTIRLHDGDNWAASEAFLKGTNSGSLPDLEATGRQIDLKVGYITRFDDDGLITSLKLFIDSMVILGQLGLQPVPRSVEG